MMRDLQPINVEEGSLLRYPAERISQEGPFVLKPGETHSLIWISYPDQDGLVQALASDTEIRTTVSKASNGNWTILVENFSMLGRQITFYVLISYFP